MNSVTNKTGGGKTCACSGLKRVFICSPFRGSGRNKKEKMEDLRRNLGNARAACNFAVLKGCIPYAPNLYFPQFLEDSDPKERNTGISLGLEWLRGCDELWVIGRKVSAGMEKEIRQAGVWGIPVIRYVGMRSPEERLLDAILFPETEFHDMVL